MSREFTEDGMPLFLDTSGNLTGRQKADIYQMIAHLQESDHDNRQWLREIELRIDDLIESLPKKKKWWHQWKS